MNSEYITQPISAKLSASLLKACQEAGIPEPTVIWQGAAAVCAELSDRQWVALDHPQFSATYLDRLVFIKHPTLADVTAAHTIDEYDQ